MGPSRASQRLQQWLDDNDTSQKVFAEMLTAALKDVAGERSAPINQSSVSWWAQGKRAPGDGAVMVAIAKLTGIDVTEWIARPDPSIPAPPSSSSVVAPRISRTG